MLNELKMAADAAKTVYEIVKATNDLQRHGELLGAVTVVQEQLQAALLANLALVERLNDIQTKLAAAEEVARRVESTADLRRAYVLKEVYRGVVLEPRIPPENGEAPRFLCVTCMDKGVATTLQPIGDAFHCHPCNATILRSKPRPKQRLTRQSSFVRDW